MGADVAGHFLSPHFQVRSSGYQASKETRDLQRDVVLSRGTVQFVEIGDEVVIIGSQGEERITAYELADLAGTIPYEVLCNIAARVPRALVD